MGHKYKKKIRFGKCLSGRTGLQEACVKRVGTVVNNSHHKTSVMRIHGYKPPLNKKYNEEPCARFLPVTIS